MIHIKDHKTPDMFDPFPFLGPKRKQRIEASWAKIFREHILPTLPVEKVFSKYDPVRTFRMVQRVLGLTSKPTATRRLSPGINSHGRKGNS